MSPPAGCQRPGGPRNSCRAWAARRQYSAAEPTPQPLLLEQHQVLDGLMFMHTTLPCALSAHATQQPGRMAVLQSSGVFLVQAEAAAGCGVHGKPASSIPEQQRPAATDTPAAAQRLLHTRQRPVQPLQQRWACALGDVATSPRMTSSRQRACGDALGQQQRWHFVCCSTAVLHAGQHTGATSQQAQPSTARLW